MSGESGLLQLAAIREYLPRYAPRITLWVYCEGIDLEDLHDESVHSLLVRYLEPNFTQHLSTRQNEIDDALRRRVVETETAGRQVQQVGGARSFASHLARITKLWGLRD